MNSLNSSSTDPIRHAPAGLLRTGDEPLTSRERWRYRLKKALFNRATETLVCCATGVGIPILAHGWLESLRIGAREIEARLAGLPDAFDGYRIAFVSDLHVISIGRRERRLLELAASLEADLLLLGGDYPYDDPTDPGPAFEVVRRLATGRDYPDGVAAIAGNHDWIPMKRLLHGQRFARFLEDGALRIERPGAEARLAIFGGAYGEKRPWLIYHSLRRLVRQRRPDDFPILLAHTPDHFPLAAKFGFRLGLAGDTHGGQIRLPGIGAPYKKTNLPQRFCLGPNTIDDLLCYTTSGIGLIGLACRINCRPEIVRLTLRAAPPGAASEWRA